MEQKDRTRAYMTSSLQSRVSDGWRASFAGSRSYEVTLLRVPCPEGITLYVARIFALTSALLMSIMTCRVAAKEAPGHQGCRS